MKLLAVETAFEACSVALSLDGERRHRFETAPRGHARLLLPWVEALLSETGVSLADLDAVAFSCGPGSFTSLRIGISVVQGLAWGADLPVVPVSSLQATAQVAARDGVRRALVAMDARMNEVYAGRFERLDGVMSPAGHERVCTPAEAAGLAVAGDTGVGNGFERYAELANLQGLTGTRAAVWPDASAVVTLAEAWLTSNAPLPAEQAQPVYLRDKVADKPGEGARA